MKEKLKENKGITLIALIITIIILLILAVVSINIVKSEGLIAKAKNATKTYTDAQELEGVNLAIADAKIANNGGEVTLENLRNALNSQFGTGNYTFNSETAPFKFIIKNGTGREYTVQSNGSITYKVYIDTAALLQKYPLKAEDGKPNGCYIFKNNNFPNAYNEILEKYGKTIRTTDALTSYIALNTMYEMYKTQEGIDELALQEAIKGNYLVNVGKKLSYYSSNFGYEKQDEFFKGSFKKEELNEMNEMMEAGRWEEYYNKLFDKSIDYHMAFQMQWISNLQAKTFDNNKYVLISNFSGNYGSTEEEFKDNSEAIKAIFRGGLFTGRNMIYNTTDTSYITDHDNSLLNQLKIEKINDSNFSKYTLIDNIEISDTNKESMKQEYKNKIVAYSTIDNGIDRIGTKLVNSYIIDMENATSCYVDENGYITEGNLNF